MHDETGSVSMETGVRYDYSPGTAPDSRRKKAERRTKDAQRTPGKGRMERTSADAPFGARLKALLHSFKLAGFSLGSVLMLAHQVQL
jgi:hypothetical protein